MIRSQKVLLIPVSFVALGRRYQIKRRFRVRGLIEKDIHIVVLNAVMVERAFPFLYSYFITLTHEKEASYPYLTAIGEMGSDAVITR